MEKQIRILSTKKLLPNQKQFLLNAGFSVIESDFIQVSSKPFVLEDIDHNLIFTSRNAVKSFLENKDSGDLKAANSFCVGLKTKLLLEENGFKVIAYSENAATLAELLKDEFKNESFTFFSGNIRLETLPLNLKIAGIRFNEIEVYDTVLKPNRISTKPDGLLFFSPSAVESYLIQNKIIDEACFCIGGTTAKTLEATTKNITIASQPSVENVIIKCINHYNKKH